MGHMDGHTDRRALDALRLEAGITWAELAIRAGVSYSLIKKAGKSRHFSRLAATKVARALNCRVGDFARFGPVPADPGEFRAA